MGIVDFGIPKPLVQSVRQHFDIRAFIETGTFRGDTTEFAATLFDQVFTVEASDERYQQVLQRFANRPAITCLHGDSPSALRQILPPLAHTPTLFWLDAHWMADNHTAANECPVLQELDAINQSNVEAFILIDDARYFLSPAPAPHNPDNWPGMATLIPPLSAHDRYIIITRDVIIAFPQRAKPFLIDYGRAQAFPWTPPAIYYAARRELPNITIP